jgi:hypothetical protein
MKSWDKPILLYLCLAFFSIPHLIDDFLFDIPSEFGISNLLAQILTGIFILIFMIIFKEIVLEEKRGYLGGAGMGIFLGLAGITKHVPLMLMPGPYWSGWFSEGLIIGLIISGFLLAIYCLRKVYGFS